ncbi:hypothetical protein IPC1227_04240 [Pseudomonas aeruginosa]|nr:hypothetical protein IPC1227_04240 [Pseudomonas aeruginosa]
MRGFFLGAGGSARGTGGGGYPLAAIRHSQGFLGAVMGQGDRRITPLALCALRLLARDGR